MYGVGGSRLEAAVLRLTVLLLLGRGASTATEFRRMRNPGSLWSLADELWGDSGNLPRAEYTSLYKVSDGEGEKR